MKRAAKIIGLFLLWSIGTAVVLFAVPAPWGILPLCFLLWLFLWGVGGGAGKVRTRRRQAVLRLRPPSRGAMAWSLAVFPVATALSAAAGNVWAGLVEIPPESANPILPLMGTPMGRLQVAVYVIAVAPVAEEWLFRGLVQRPLERRAGAAGAIALAAALFAAAHVLPRVFPLLFLLGVVLGYVAWATRSIWPPVVLHAGHNAFVLAVLVLGGPQETAPTLWEAGPSAEWWVSLGALLASAALLVPLARRLRDAGRGAPA